MVQTPTEDSFSKGLTPKGLSVNHEKLSENIQEIEKLTQLRRAEFFYPSEVLGESFLMDFQIHKMKCIRFEIRFSDTPTNSNLHKIFFKVNTIIGIMILSLKL